jgi:hypothetical protein
VDEIFLEEIAYQFNAWREFNSIAGRSKEGVNNEQYEQRHLFQSQNL